MDLIQIAEQAFANDKVAGFPEFKAYILGEDMTFVSASNSGVRTGKKTNATLMITFGSTSCPKSLVEIGSYFLSYRDQTNPISTYGCVTWFNPDGTRNRNSCFVGDDSVNNLSDPANPYGVLSAKTGKAIKDTLESTIINGGTTAPTTTTVGAVGTQYNYVDTAGTPTAHICVCTGVDTTDPNNPVYAWQTLI